jgi:hypothetical protein
MVRPHDPGVDPKSSSPSFERPMAAPPHGTQSGGMAHATALQRQPVRLLHKAAARLHELREAAERGDDLGAIAVALATVAVFVFSIVGILTAVTLSLYFTTG